MATSIGGLTINNPLALSQPASKSASPLNATGLNLSGNGLSIYSLPGLSPLSAPAGSVLGASTTVPNTPAAAAGPRAAQNQFNNEQASTMDSINSGIDTGAGDYNQGILDIVNGNKNSQAAINAQAVQNELAKSQGLQGVTDMVGNGIQGGGVVLDNDNAGTSSAADALARAYGVQGRQAASQVGNQYAQGQNTINTSQTALNNNETAQVGDLNQKKADTINSIVNTANQQLTYLNAIASSASLPDQINIAQQIASIKAQATSALSAYDGELSGVNTTEIAQPAAQAQAQQLLTAGVAPTQAFNYTSQAPATLQNTGPAASDLPIYIAPSNKSTVPTTA